MKTRRATVDDPVTTGIGSSVAVRRLVSPPFFGTVLTRPHAFNPADDIEVIRGHSLDRS
jgi:hypothetical protein